MSRHNWIEMFSSGLVWRMYQGKDFEVSLDAMISPIRKAARRYGVRVSCYKNSKPDCMWVDFQTPDPENIIAPIKNYLCPTCKGPIAQRIRGTHNRDKFICCKGHQFSPLKAIRI